MRKTFAATIFLVTILTLVDYWTLWRLVRPWKHLIWNRYLPYIVGFVGMECIFSVGLIWWLGAGVGFRESGRKLASVDRRFQSDELALTLERK